MSIPVPDPVSRFARVAGASAIATASKSAKAAGATSMVRESFLGATLMTGLGLAADTVAAPGFATKMVLILCGSFAGALVAAMFMDHASGGERLRRFVGSAAFGFIAAYVATVAFPSLAKVGTREWLIVLSGVPAGCAWFFVMWAKRRDVFNATLDHWAERIGLKMSKRNRREKDEHEDGGP